MSKVKKLWVTNVNMKRDVKIDDLGIVIPAGKSKNLLAPNCRFPKGALEKSLATGSLAKKSHWLKIREVGNEPVPLEATSEESIAPKKTRAKRETSPARFSKKRTVVEVETPKYEDLDFDETGSDEEFVSDLEDVGFMDSMPLISRDDK